MSVIVLDDGTTIVPYNSSRTGPQMDSAMDGGDSVGDLTGLTTTEKSSVIGAINEVNGKVTNLNLYSLKENANILNFITKHENEYIPRITGGNYVIESMEGYCWYEVPIPSNKTGMVYIKKHTNMTKGQHIIIADESGHSYINIGYNTTPTQTYYDVTDGYIGINLGNLLSREAYEGATKILIGYTDADVHECYVVGGKTTDSLSDVIFPYARGSYPFISTADFNDGNYSKTSIRNAITNIKLNVFGYKNAYIGGIYWNVINESFYILVKATDTAGNVVSVCSFPVPYTDTGIKSYNSQQSTSNGEAVGVIDIDVSKIKASEITTRNMNTHDYFHFGMLDTVFASSTEIVPPLRFYSMAGMTNEWYLKNTIYGNPDNYFIRYNESVTAHYNADFDRRRTSVTPSNEAKGGGAIAYYLESMTHEKPHEFNVNYLRAAKNGLANKTVKALFIGDSLIDNGYTCKAIKELFDTDASGARIELYGTRNSQGVVHEGHAGWGTYDILHTESYNNISNAFYNPSTNVFDFSYYCNKYNIPTLDWIVIQLGVNNIFRPMQGTTTVQNIQTMIDSIRTVMPGTKIAVATPPQPYLGGKYSCLNFRPAEWAHKFRLDLAKEIISTFGKNVASTQVYVVSIHSVTDTDYNYIMAERPVNSESSVTEQYCTDITHYAESAHKQVAKQYYCLMKYVE